MKTYQYRNDHFFASILCDKTYTSLHFFPRYVDAALKLQPADPVVTKFVISVSPVRMHMS